MSGDNKSPINEGEMADVGAPAGVRSSEGPRGVESSWQCGIWLPL